MEAFILRYWQFFLGLLLGVLFTGYMGLWVHRERMEMLQGQYQAAANKQITAAAAQCRDNQKLTEEVARELQNQNDDLADRLDAAQRLYGNSCVVPVPAADATGRGDETSRAGHAERDGIPAGRLLAYGGKAESIRQQLTACQAFISRTWALNGQPLQ